MRKLIYIFIITVAFGSLSIAQNSPAKAYSFAEIRTGDEKFDRTFREARELMDKEEWAKAAEKFNQIICNCPDENKQADAALYWLAYCYKKQKMYDEARETLGKIEIKFPKSNWLNDAQIMRIEVNRLMAQVANSRGTGQSYSVSAPLNVVGQSNLLTGTTAVAGVYNQAKEDKLDREDEVRLAAFQSLFAADPNKGIEVLSNILGANSKASESLKREILRTLRGSRYGILSRHIGSWSNTEPATASLEKEKQTQILSAIRDLYIKHFQAQTNNQIRADIIYSLASINDETSFNFLAQTYPNETNKDLKRAIINSFGGGNYTFVSGQAAYAPFILADRYETERAVATVSGQSGSNKTQATNAILELRFNKLMEIFRIERDLELRRLALGNIQRFSGWSTRDGMIDSLSQMYDSETDEQFKVSVIYSFSSLPKNAQATNKLFNIAKNDKSDKMRLEAIRALRNNNSPEVIKFLEDLIK